MIAATGQLMKKIDKSALEKASVFEYVERAADAVFSEIVPFAENKKTVVLCGCGSCGADGYALASKLVNEGYDCVCIDLSKKENKNQTVLTKAKDCTASILDCVMDRQKALGRINDADIIVDAIFGFGFDVERKMDENIAAFIALANKSDALRVAIDLPSGVSACDGRVAECVFSAHITVSFTAYKVGLCSYPAKEYCGKVILKDIGISVCEYEKECTSFITDDTLLSYLPQRKKNTNKSSFGRLLCLCGSKNMTGSAYLSVSGALRSGVGYCYFASDVHTVRILQSSLYECIFLPLEENEGSKKEFLAKATVCDAVLIGCGIGNNEFYKELIFELIENCEKQIILDADGINLVCENKNILRKAKKPIILTPHPLEFSRLSGCSVEKTEQNRFVFAKSFAKEYGCILVLKGDASIITDGNVAYINSSGNAGLAKAGSGDVLSGVISSLCAQGMQPLYAAACGVYSHGKAGDILEGELSQRAYLPSDLPKVIGSLLK